MFATLILGTHGVRNPSVSEGSPGTAVKDLMSADPATLDETDSVATALNKMSMGRYRHIPVQKADGTYCVTSIKHVLKYLAQAEW